MCILFKEITEQQCIHACNASRGKSIHSLLQSEAPTINFKSST